MAWLSLILLTTFNVMDTLGRYLAGVSCLVMSRSKTLWLTYLRTLQVGIFLLTAFEISPEWLFGADWFKMLNFSIFAFTNGYLSSLCSIKAPEVVKHRQSHQVGPATGTADEVGAFIGVTKCLGILIGSTLAVPIKEIIKLTPAVSGA